MGRAGTADSAYSGGSAERTDTLDTSEAVDHGDKEDTGGSAERPRALDGAARTKATVEKCRFVQTLDEHMFF